MGNLFFPQLSTGALAQYPIKKTAVTRAITNLLADGTMILQADSPASKLIWEMAFTELSPADASALQTHFQACVGPYHAFTFIDPTDNLLASSTDLTNTSWARSPLMTISSGTPDPNGGTGAFVLTNTGDASQQLTQQLTIPANYHYCFSLYALSAEPFTLELVRQGSVANAIDSFAVGPNWNRIISTGQLNDPGTQFAVGVNLAPGQQITVFGLQLEGQIQPSRYRPTIGSGGVYSNAHWTSDTLMMISQAPNLFSTSFAIQTNI